MNDVYISSIPTDANIDIIGQCIDAKIDMQVDTLPFKHGDGEPICRKICLTTTQQFDRM